MEQVDSPGSGDQIYPGDYDGDGATDLFVTIDSFDDTNWLFYLSKENNTPDEKTLTSSFDLLTKHTSSLSGITSIAYTPTSDQDMTDGTMADLHKLPFILYLVRSVTLDDRVTNTGDDKATYTYKYFSGKYDFPTREFRGFGAIFTTDPDNIMSRKYYFQDSKKKGINRKTRKYLSSNTSDGYALSLYRWKTTDTDAASVKFLYLDQKKTAINSDSQETQIKFVCYGYDSKGNTTSIIESENSGCSEGLKSTFKYENVNSNKWIWHKTEEITGKLNTDGSFSEAKRTTFNYDTNGNLNWSRSYYDSSNYIEKSFS